MMKMVRAGLVMGLALLIAAPVFAQGGGGGKGKGGMRGGNMATMRITMALRGLDLNDEEKTATNEILAGIKEKAAELQKKSAWTEEQRGKLREVMQALRDENVPRGEMQAKLNEKLGASDEQKQAQKDMATLVEETAKKIKVALKDKGEAFEKAMTAPPRGGRGKAAKKAEA